MTDRLPLKRVEKEAGTAPSPWANVVESGFLLRFGGEGTLRGLSINSSWALAQNV